MAYSALGDVVSLTDPNGNATTSAYDSDRRLTNVTAPPAPASLVSAFTYDPDGRLLQTQQLANGSVLKTVSASYSPSGKLATATDADDSVTGCAYDAVDRLSQVTDAAGRVTTYSYDAFSRRTGVFNPAVQSAALPGLAYTPDGVLASLTDANGNATSYTPDGLDRLATTTFPDTSTETLAYDADGNILTQQTPRGDTIAFTYDTLNRLSTKAAPSEATVTWGYDLDGHMTNVGDASAAVTAPSTSASYAASTSYDALNRPLMVSWSPAATQTAPTASGVTFNHGYDPTNRRISQSATDNSWWSYPPNTTTTTTGYTANNLNQYSAVGAVSPTGACPRAGRRRDPGDGDGNLTYDGVFTYGYDAESRLISVAQGSTAVASYAYDAQGRRKLKTVGSTTTVSVTDADNREVMEYDGSSGAGQRWYAFGQGPDAVLGQMNVALGTRESLPSGLTRGMIPDIQGSIIGMLDSGGSLAKSGYQPYGENPTLTAGTFQYTARRFDPETAGSTAQPSGLYYYRARMYSPTWGRFPQPDPIRLRRRQQPLCLCQ
jgi:RHS repeat-associated protein